MKLDDFNSTFNSAKVSKVLEDKFGTKLDLNKLNLKQLETLKVRVSESHKKMVKNMPFNSGHRNPEYLEQVALLEAIELRINEIDQMDEDIPTAMKQQVDAGQTSTNDNSWVSIHMYDNLRSLKNWDPRLGALASKIVDQIGKSNIDQDDKVELSKMLSHFGAFAKEPRYDDAEDWFNQAFNSTRLRGEYDKTPELKSVLGQIRKLVHGIMWNHEKVDESAKKGWEDTVQGMRQHPEVENPWAPAKFTKPNGYKPGKKIAEKHDIHKHEPHATAKMVKHMRTTHKKDYDLGHNGEIKPIDNWWDEYITVNEIKDEEDMKKMDSPFSGTQTSALLKLVGPKNIVKAKRAIQLASQDKAIPSNLVSGFKPIVDILSDILQGGSSYVSRLKSLDKQASRNINESRYLAEGETEKAQLIMAVKDMVDRVQGMVEDLNKMKVEDLVALTDKMRDEFGQEQATSFTAGANDILSAGIDALTNARTEMDNAVLALTGEAPAAAPTAGMAPGEELPAPDASAELPAPDASAELPAPEGGEEVGRELRESRKKVRKILDSSRFLGKLAK